MLNFWYMTIKTALRRNAQRKTKKRTPQMIEREELAWAGVIGMLKNKKKIDPVRYQRRIRKEADRNRV